MKKRILSLLLVPALFLTLLPAAAGGPATFYIQAMNAATCQWQYRTSASGAWANATAEGNNTAPLKVPAAVRKNGYQYRCAVSNAVGTVYSSVVTLTVE